MRLQRLLLESRRVHRHTRIRCVFRPDPEERSLRPEAWNRVREHPHELHGAEREVIVRRSLAIPSPIGFLGRPPPA